MPISRVLDRIKQDRLERQKERQAELEKFETELAVRREARKAERDRLRQYERQSDIVLNKLISRSINFSLSTIDMRNAEQSLKQAQIEAKTKEIRSRVDLGKETFDIRRQRMKALELIRRKKKIPPRPKRYVVHPAEFYGIDFSPASPVDQRQRELYEIQQRRVNQFLQNPDHLNILTEKGNAFIKAMSDAVTLDEDTIQSLVRRKRSLASFQAERFATTSQTFSDCSTANQSTNMISSQNLNDIKASVESVSNWFQRDANPETAATITEPESTMVKKKWNQLLPKNNIDYSDYFHDDILDKDGLTVYRIEDMRPIPQSSKLNQLCVGDCYILLHIKTLEKGQRDIKIYQWIGKESSIDKKACSAIHAVGLRQFLQTDVQVIREESGEESEEFLNIFRAYDCDVQHTSAQDATPSALFNVEEPQYPLLVYHVFAKQRKRVPGHKQSALEMNERFTSGDMDLTLVAPSVHSFHSKRVLIIDTGKIIYQWNGKQSTLSDRSKARMFGQRLCNDNSPPRKPELIEVEQGEESDEFWKVFDGEQFQEDGEGTETILSEPILYVLDESLTQGNLGGTSIHDFVVYPTEDKNSRLSRNQLQTKVCCVLDCHAEVFFWIGKATSRLLRRIAEALLQRKIYPARNDRPEHVSVVKFFEGVESEPFKTRFSDWNKQMINRVDFTKKIQPVLTALPQRPKTGMKADIQALYTPAPTGKYTPEEEEFVETLFSQANALLQSLQAFMFDSNERRFVRLPDWTVDGGREKCHLWTEECYVFLCIYNRAVQKDEDSEDVHGSKPLLSPEETDVAQECVAYFWYGRQSPRPSMGKLIFQFQFRGIVESLLKRMSGGNMEMRVVEMEQEQESMAILAHFDRECIIHNGPRPKSFPPMLDKPSSNDNLYSSSLNALNANLDLSHIALYHIRTDPRYKVSRAIQVPPMITSLCTRSIYFLTYTHPNDTYPHQTNFLWIGRGASKDEERRATQLALRILQFRFHQRIVQADSGTTTSRDKLSTFRQATTPVSQLPFQVIRERTEPKQFWAFLGPKMIKPARSSVIPFGQGYYYSVPPPRMFRCATTSGSFQITDLGYQFCFNDLYPTSVCLLDSGPGLGRPHILYAWVGKDASDVVIKLSKKAVESYFDHWNDGRSLDRSEWDSSRRSKGRLVHGQTNSSGHFNGPCDVKVVEQGKEEYDFRSFFLGWGEPFNVDEEGRESLNLSEAQVNQLKLAHQIKKREIVFLKENGDVNVERTEPTDI